MADRTQVVPAARLSGHMAGRCGARAVEDVPRPAHRTRPAAAAGQLGRTNANGTMLRLRALYVMGHGSARIACATGVGEQVIQRVTRGGSRTVSLAVRDSVARVYDLWWDLRAPERTGAERAAAARARHRARRGDWCAGAALDDDGLDQPGYRPRHGWLPASGTGIADQSGHTIWEGIG
jgi:hypothetical protein